MVKAQVIAGGSPVLSIGYRLNSSQGDIVEHQADIAVHSSDTRHTALGASMAITQGSGLLVQAVDGLPNL